MSQGYAIANSKRSWYISDFYVWGTAGWGEFEYILIENIDSVQSVFINIVTIGDNAQEVSFIDLVDYRGNQLPDNIVKPKVFIKPRSENTVFLVGEESNNKFKIARQANASGPVKTDLYIVEMGA
jgi:hypothetical protein